MFSADEAFLAGLIHDVGILVEIQGCGLDFARVIRKLTQDETLTFREAEREVLGASHEDFGAGLCRAWNFSESLQFVTGWHHRPWELAEAQRGLPTLVHIADVLAARNGLGYARTVETGSIAPDLLRSVNLTEADLDAAARALPEAISESQLPLDG
jgi:HD-like signal output (HDOD) protein